MHSAFCPQNESSVLLSVHESRLSSIFHGYNANSLVFFVDKRRYGVLVGVHIAKCL